LKGVGRREPIDMVRGDQLLNTETPSVEFSLLRA
jgi:hypothetical protein